MQTIQDTAAMSGSNRYGRPFAVLDIRKQITVLVEVLGDAHLQRKKPVSFKTKKERARFSQKVVSELHRAGLNIRNVLNLGQRHIQAIVDWMLASGMSPGTIQTRLSLLRWLATAAGKRGLVLEPERYGITPEDIDRVYVAQTDKSWDGRGADTDAAVARAMEMDTWAGTSLLLMKEFGLRLTEAILIRPHVSDTGPSLVVEEGTKGGRTRVVAIQSESQRQAIDRAKALSVATRRGALVPPGKTPQQARSRIYYICKKIGLEIGKIGLNPHGLRHGFANDLYEEVAGTPSVVRGASTILDRAADERGRQAVSQALGHKRLSIVAAYTGSKKGAKAPRTRPVPTLPSPGRSEG